MFNNLLISKFKGGAHAAQSAWDEFNVTLCQKMQKLQNRAARVITKSSYDVSSSILLEKLHWDNLSLHQYRPVLFPTYKTINNPEYLQNLFSLRSTL